MKLPLLQDRVEIFPKGGRSDSAWLFRAYLLLHIPAHCIALTQLVTSCHELAIKHGRWFQICRLCRDDIENKLHVLFLCEHPDLIDLHRAFLAHIWSRYPTLKNRAGTPLELFHLVMGYHDLLPHLGRYMLERILCTLILALINSRECE
ncbi:hypothetical protein F5146DRAFT_939025 [Armillaria mellea]|nr:hypothetical protein F5146DRAFT_939025 [Armillaria mellea]